MLITRSGAASFSTPEAESLPLSMSTKISNSDASVIFVVKERAADKVPVSPDTTLSMRAVMS